MSRILYGLPPKVAIQRRHLIDPASAVIDR